MTTTSRAARRVLATSSVLLLAAWLAPLPGHAEKARPAEGPYRVVDGVTRPELISKVDPVLTDLARLAELTGTVILEAVIDERGHPQEIEISKGLALGLDVAAVRSLKQWKFEPATKDGRPVRVYYLLTIKLPLAPSHHGQPVAALVSALPKVAAEMTSGSFDEAERKLRDRFSADAWRAVEPDWCLLRQRSEPLSGRCAEVVPTRDGPRYKALVEAAAVAWTHAHENPKAPDVDRYIAFGLDLVEPALDLDRKPFEALVFKTHLLNEKAKLEATPEGREAVLALARSARDRALALRPDAAKDGVLPKL